MVAFLEIWFEFNKKLKSSLRIDFIDIISKHIVKMNIAIKKLIVRIDSIIICTNNFTVKL